jgi:hypothetical protein
MGQSPKKVELDPQSLREANDMWGKFVALSKISIAVTILVLGAMALFLL